MKTLAVSLLSIVLTVLSDAAEIIAWKAPLSNLGYGIEAPEVVRLKTPPEKSPFFGKNDELWDIHAALPEDAASAAWAVWNQNTGRIVVKGSWVAIHEVEKMIHIPSHCRITVDAFRVVADGSAPDFSKKPDASISLVVGSGRKATASKQENDSAISLEAEPTTGDEEDFVDLRLMVSASLPGSPALEINTGLSFKAGESIWVARDFDGKSGTDIRVTAAIELTDGTPYAEMMMRQEGDSAVPFRVDRSGSKRISIEGGGSLVSVWLEFGNVKELIAGEKADETDPFAATPDTEPAVDLKGLPTAQVPEKLEPYFGGEVLNLRETVGAMGLSIGENDFVGYDQLSQRVFMFSTNEDEIDKFEQLNPSICCLQAPLNVAVSLQEIGQTRLMGRSGQKASLKSIQAETKLSRFLETEPTVSETGDLVDLRILFEEKSDIMLTRGINTAVTLTAGELLEIMTSKLPDGSDSAVKIKAEILVNP